MKAQLEAWSNALLGVAICLREDAEGRDGQDAEAEVKTGEEIEVEAEVEAKPTIGGTMCLGGVRSMPRQRIIIAWRKWASEAIPWIGWMDWMVDWAITHLYHSVIRGQ